MKSDYVKGEVSTRLIVVLAVVIVLVFTAAILGGIFYPKIRERLREESPEKYEIILKEDFESGKLSSEWQSWNPNQICIDEKIKRSGKYSCRMTGSLRGRNSSGIRRSCESRLPIVIEFDCYNGNEPFNNRAHAGKGMVLLFRGGASDHVWLFSFHQGGNVGLGRVPMKKVKWEAGRWYHVKLELEVVRNKLLVKANVSGRICKKEFPNTREWLNKWENIDFSFSCGQGTAYFDNIRIYQAVKND